MSTVATILSATGYRLGGGITISATSDPSQATCIQWLNEIALWITGLCAEYGSDLGRTIGTIPCIYASISGASQASPCAITATAHGLMSSGTREVLIRSVSGMTELNDTEYNATYSSANAVNLYSINSATTAIDSSSYTAYASSGYITKRKYDTLASYIYTPCQEGWIVDTHTRYPLKLRDESCLTEYDPVEATQPCEFYIDGSNNVCFPSYPDDSYVVKIPYYQIPTTLSQTTDTMPFLGLLDNVFIEALTIRAQNRDEYDTTIDLKWMSFLNDRARAVIAMRKATISRVTLA